MSVSGYVAITNNTFINSTKFWFAIIEFNNVDNTLIARLYINNVIATDYNSENLINALLTETPELTLSTKIQLWQWMSK